MLPGIAMLCADHVFKETREVRTTLCRYRAIIGSAAALCLAAGIGACSLDIKGRMAGDAGLDDTRTDEGSIDATTEDGPGDTGGDAADEGYDREEETALDAEPCEVSDAFTEAEIDAPGDFSREEQADLMEPDAEELPAECAGVMVGGYCWYASGMDESCAGVCAVHGGCNLAGTRDYAGSGGTDAQCVAVLEALGYGGYPHQDNSNNDLGCHFAWLLYTYWSTEYETTCEAFPFIGEHDPSVFRMCACEW
ncbi:MAG: hypothetical protein ABIJ56_16650 [Pseudomonadota bacterium]